MRGPPFDASDSHCRSATVPHVGRVKVCGVRGLALDSAAVRSTIGHIHRRQLATKKDVQLLCESTVYGWRRILSHVCWKRLRNHTFLKLQELEPGLERTPQAWKRSRGPNVQARPIE